MDTVKFGASLSTSGRYALQGRQALAGLRAWAEATKAEGGVRMAGLGRRAPVNLIHYDDAGSPTRTAKNVERLIRVDGVHVLLGPYASDLTRVAARAARRYGKVLWNHGGASDDIHLQGGRVVGIPTPASGYFAGLLELVRSIDPAARNAVVLYRRGSAFGRIAARGADATGRQAGFSVATLTYSSHRLELPLLLERLQRRCPELILSAGAFKDECALARGLIASGVRAKAFGFVSAAMEDFREALGSEAEGFFGPSQWEPVQERPPDFGPAADAVASRIRAMGAAPDYPASQAYAACLIAQRCLEETASMDDEALWQAACALDCTTFFGRFRIDPETGLQVAHEMVWVQWRGGRKRVVWPAALAETDG